MKKKNAKCDYIPARNAELKRVFMGLLGSGAPSLDHLFAAVARSGADRFYVSEERALSMLLRKRRSGEWPEDIRPIRKKMMEEIERRVAYLIECDPSLSLAEAVFKVVNSPAPQFYITAGSIRTILYNSLAG